ncbi:MAG: hypothetical protein ABIS69_02755 [Sediminibacterium sp.]
MHRSFIFSLPFLLFACTQHSIKINYDNDVQEIIAANITETIGTGDSAKMAYRFPPVQEIDNGQYKKYYDSIRSLLDTSFTYIAIIDSFTQTHNTDLEDINQVQKVTKDNDMYGLLHQLIADTTSRAGLNLKTISERIGIPVKKGRRKYMDDLHCIAQFHFSKIAFNKGKTKASIYQQYYCGGTCGYGEMRFLEKKENKWIVMHKIRTWIS